MIDIVPQNNNLGNNATKLLYRVVNDLLYFDDDERGLRLYILTAEIEKEVFTLVYNKIEYPGYIRTYKRLINSLYIYKLLTKLYKFIGHCPYY